MSGDESENSDGRETAVRTFFDDVGVFHAKFNLPVTGVVVCGLPTPEVLEYRTKFLQEELQEFIDAGANNDLAGMLDALVDLAWVAMGTAHYLGAPFNEAWAEVRRANMAKVLKTEADPTHKRGVVERIFKPAWWVPPRIAEIINQHKIKMLRGKYL